MDLRQSFSNRQNRSSAPSTSDDLQAAVAAKNGTQSDSLQKTLLICTSVIAAALIVAVLCAASIISHPLKADQANRTNKMGYTGIASDRYQAVFLTNGQVYFGKLSDAGQELINLKDIWYLQVQQGAQADALKNNQSQISLAKLGNELLGPDDSLSISKDQVLFWENLKNDSKVVKAINDAK
jgi:hypothetical protein